MPEEVTLDFSEVHKPIKLDPYQTGVIKGIERGETNICAIGVPASGKTRLLHASILKLLEREVNPEDILPFTFEVAARDVLRERLKGTTVRAYSIHGHGMKASKNGRKAFLENGRFSDLLTERAEGEKLYKWVICDEGQDLSGDQYRNFLSWGENHILVGDPLQSIFGWAGGSPSYLIEDFIPLFCEGQFYPLSINHRSAESIVSMAERFFPRGMVWGGTRGAGIAEVTWDDPPNLENITILYRTNDEVVRYSIGLRNRGISHTRVVTQDSAKKVTNWVGGVESEVSNRKDFLPTLVETIHAAKGDEWDRVWLKYYRVLPGLNEEEEERIFYVGLTRAQKELYVFPTNSLVGRLQ